jgi:hypothetical protein
MMTLATKIAVLITDTRTVRLTKIHRIALLSRSLNLGTDPLCLTWQDMRSPVGIRFFNTNFLMIFLRFPAADHRQWVATNRRNRVTTQAKLSDANAEHLPASAISHPWGGSTYVPTGGARLPTCPRLDWIEAAGASTNGRNAHPYFSDMRSNCHDDVKTIPADQRRKNKYRPERYFFRRAL